MNRFNKFQVPKSAAMNATSHVLGMNMRKANMAEGDGTSLSEHGGNQSKQKDKRFGGGNAPNKQTSINISFGETGLTGRS